MSLRLITYATVVLTAAGSLTMPAAASPKAAPPVLQLAQAPQQAPQEEELVAFATATIRIHQIQTTMLNEAEEAAPEEVPQIQAEAQAAMIAVVEEQGFTVERYNSIAQLVRTDPDVAETVDGLIQQQLDG